MLWITTGVFLDQCKPCQRKLEIFFFRVPFHWSYAVINNGICHLWCLLSDHNPRVALFQPTLLEGTFLFYFTCTLFLIESSLPWNFSSHVGEYIQFAAGLCHTVTMNSISQGVCILLHKVDVSVNKVGSARVCPVSRAAFISGPKMGMSLNELSECFPSHFRSFV